MNIKCRHCGKYMIESVSGFMCAEGCGGLILANGARMKRWFKSNPVDGLGRKPLEGQQDLFDRSRDGADH